MTDAAEGEMVATMRPDLPGFRRATGHRRGSGRLGRVIALARPNAFHLRTRLNF
jgi:hypothetical protein